MGVPVNPPPPPPHLPSPCLWKIKMHGSSKMAWIDALRTTRYRLILMLCRDVFMFVVKQGVPRDEDLEWLYPSCLLYGKIFLELFVRLQTRDINGISPNPFTWWWQFFLVARKKKKNMTSSVRVCGCAFFVPNDAQKGCIMQWHKLATINLLAQIKCSVLIIFLHSLSCRWFY